MLSNLEDRLIHGGRGSPRDRACHSSHRLLATAQAREEAQGVSDLAWDTLDVIE